MAGSNLPGSDSASIGRRMVSGTVANYIGQFVTLATGFFLTPFVLHQLGPAQYGLWVLIASIVAYGTVLDFGIWGTVVKYVAEYHARGEMGQAHSLVATALRLYVILGLAAAGLGVAVAPFIPDLFRIPDADRATAEWLTVLSGLGVGVSIPCVTATAVLRGLQRFDLANLLVAGGTLLTGAATIIALLLDGGILGMAAVVIPASILMQIPSIWLVNRVAPELHFGWRGAKLSDVRTIVSFSSSLFVMQLAGRLQAKTNEIVIGAFLPVSSVTPYALARRLSEMVSLLCEQSTKVMMPLASQLAAGGEWGRLRAIYVASSRLTLALAMMAGITVMMLAAPLLAVWVGPTYAGGAHLVTILTVAGIVWASQLPAGSILQGGGRHRPLAAAGAVSAISNIVLSVVLVRAMGVVGVALGTLVPAAAVGLGFLLPYAARTIGVSVGRIALDVWVPALLPAIPMALTLHGLQQAISLDSLPALLVVAIAGAMVYVMAYLVIGARDEERQACRILASLILVWVKR